ncbi:ABC transporter permease [Streptococcus sp. zg-JUN1979]|uniref:ABC transporter permease n=1 Tax=Streptococcus sp. zg-JUN1979 TaxID=3391450 RepID=UPI0039AF44E8
MKNLSYNSQKSHLLSSIYRVGYIEYRALVTNKHLIYSQLLGPILYFLFYSMGISSTFGNITYANQEVPFLKFSFIGIVGLIVYSQMGQSVYRIILDRKWGLLAFKYFKGVSPLAYTIGKLSFPLFSFLLQLIVLYVISLFWKDYFSIGEFVIILLIAILMMLFWFSVGTIISLRVSSYKVRDMILNTLLLPVSFTAPIFFSFDKAPMIIRAVSYINPLTYQLNALRDMSFATSQYANVIITVSLAITMTLIALYCVQHAQLTTDER